MIDFAITSPTVSGTPAVRQSTCCGQINTRGLVDAHQRPPLVRSDFPSSGGKILTRCVMDVSTGKPERQVGDDG